MTNDRIRSEFDEIARLSASHDGDTRFDEFLRSLVLSPGSTNTGSGDTH